MNMKTSPSGSLCPYYFMGGELHPLKYGSYFRDKEKLFAIIDAEEEFILKSAGENNRRIWIDLYETTLDDEVIEKLVSHIKAIEHKILKLSFVGCSFICKRKITKQLKIKGINKPVSFIKDPEEAKQWLLFEK